MVSLFLLALSVVLGGKIAQVDIVQFKGDSAYTYIEAYFRLPVGWLEYEPADSFYKGTFSVDFFAEDTTSGKVYQHTVEKAVTIGSPSAVADKDLLDGTAFFLPPAIYRFSIFFTDKCSGKVDTVSGLVHIEDFRDIPIGDLLLATKIVYGDSGGSGFNKEGFLVMPNPSHLFTLSTSVLYVYTELYGGGDTIVEYRIVDVNGEEMYHSVKGVEGSEDVVDVRGFTLYSFPTGKYVLECRRGDFVRQAEFFVLRGSRSTGRRMIVLPIQKEYWDFIDYLATPREKKAFSRLEDESAREDFLYEFWRRRDPNPETPQNEALAEFVRRVMYADGHFSTPSRKGRFTDRGRIYIRYGKPDEITHPPQIAPYYDKPREKWFYFEGNKIFIFVDTGTEEWRLFYSSVKEEPTVSNWERWIPPEETQY